MATAADRKRRDERAKLAAAFLSNIGAAFVVGGFVGPLVLGRFNAVVAGFSWFAGLAIHLGAQRILHYVAEDPREEP